jgi:hypothetical protein
VGIYRLPLSFTLGNRRPRFAQCFLRRLLSHRSMSRTLPLEAAPGSSQRAVYLISSSRLLWLKLNQTLRYAPRIGAPILHIPYLCGMTITSSKLRWPRTLESAGMAGSLPSSNDTFARYLCRPCNGLNASRKSARPTSVAHGSRSV